MGCAVHSRLVEPIAITQPITTNGHDPITTAATAQEASINVPMQYLAMATGQNAPTQNLLTNLSNNRYSMASPAQTIVQQGNGGLLGGLASGVGSYFGARK